MTIRFACDGCGSKIKVAEDIATRRVRCPRCGVAQPVPDDASDDSSPADTAAPADDSPVTPMPAGEADPTDAEAFPELVDTTQLRDDSGGALSDRPRPTPRPRAPGGPGAGPARSVPSSSAPSAYRASPRPASVSVNRPDSPPGTAERAKAPAYAALGVLTWLFRMLAFVAVAPVIRRVVVSTGEDRDVVATATMIAAGVAVVAGLWLLGELARAARDVARNSFR
jgi:hypothetical protein